MDDVIDDIETNIDELDKKGYQYYITSSPNSSNVYYNKIYTELVENAYKKAKTKRLKNTDNQIENLIKDFNKEQRESLYGTELV